MKKSRFLDELQVDELSYGAAMCLWGFRVSVVAHARCRCVDPSFEAAFGDQGQRAREDLRDLVSGLVEEGKRQIWMAVPASLEITCDEVCILNALAAAQHDQIEALQAHLRWLLGRDAVPDDLMNRFVNAGALLYSHGYAAQPPARQPLQGVASPVNAQTRAPSNVSVRSHETLDEQLADVSLVES
ncbi:MAG: hypothetical protein AAGA68_11865 [Pseudomonadota bacterium]